MVWEFREKLEDFILKSDDWWVRESIPEFWKKNYKEIVKNEGFLLELLQKYAPSNTEDFAGFFYKILYFFQFKEENKFHSQNIVSFFKSELVSQRNTEKPRFYSNILNALIVVEWIKAKENFYQNEFQEIKKKWFLYSDITAAFLEVFIILWENQNEVFSEFSEVFSQLIIFSVHEIIGFQIENGWKYLCSLGKEDFNKEFFKILDYFDSDDKRKELVHHHKYTSIFTLDKYSNDDKRYEKIRIAIEKNFWKDEYEKFKEYIIHEISYLLDIYERAIHENTFVSWWIEILQKYDKKFYLELLESVDSKKTLWGLEDTFVKYISIEDIEKIIEILKWGTNEFTLFRIYELLKIEGKDTFTKAFEVSSYKNDIQKTLKSREETQKKI